MESDVPRKGILRVITETDLDGGWREDDIEVDDLLTFVLSGYNGGTADDPVKVFFTEEQFEREMQTHDIVFLANHVRH